MRTLLLFVIACSVAAACESSDGMTTDETDEIVVKEVNIDSIDHCYLVGKQAEAKAFCKSEGYNKHYCFLLDMSRHSGRYRFYVWDFDSNKVVDSALVSHGCGISNWGDDGTADAPVFSNEYESHCSSLGKYHVGERAWSQWGINIKYQLYGLDSTNSNANGRRIVLHSWEFVNDIEVYPDGSPEGWGCPAVSNAFMARLDTRLKKSTEPVLLWMYTH